MSAVVRFLDVAGGHKRTLRAEGQLEIGETEESLHRDRTRALHAWIQSVIEHRQVKVAASELGVSESYLSHCARGSNGNRYSEHVVAWAVGNAPNHDGVAMLASWRGLVVSPRPILTAEDALMGLLEAMTEMLSPDMARPMLDRAAERAAKRRG